MVLYLILRKVIIKSIIYTTIVELLKLGYYVQKGLKAVILTQKECYIIPFSLEEEYKQNPNQFKKHRQLVPFESFNF